MILLEAKDISQKEFDSVSNESIQQFRKWGIQKSTPTEWMSYLTEEVGELAQAINKRYGEGYHFTDMQVFHEAIQVATLALKIARMHNE